MITPTRPTSRRETVLRGDEIQRILWGTVGFIVAAGAVVLLEVVLVAAVSRPGYTLVPRGLGWVAVPVVAGIAGAGFASRFRLRNFDRLLSENRNVKLALAGAVSWFILVVGYVFVAQPFGTYWGDDEWAAFWRWLLIPPVVLLAVGGVALWGLSRNSATAAKTNQEVESVPDDLRAVIWPLISTSKYLGAKTPREAFEMTIGRQSTPSEWEKHRVPWELLWPHVPAAPKR